MQHCKQHGLNGKRNHEEYQKLKFLIESVFANFQDGNHDHTYQQPIRILTPFDYVLIRTLVGEQQ